MSVIISSVYIGKVLKTEKRTINFSSNLDTIAYERFVGLIDFISFDIFYEIESISFKTALDSNPAFTTHLTKESLQAWVNLNVSAGTKWILEVSAVYKANQINQSGVQINYIGE